MSKKIICLIFILILFSFCVGGCSIKTKEVDTEDIKCKVLIDKLESSSVVASIYYERMGVNGLQTKTYLWKDKKIIDSNDVYNPTYSNIYPSSSINKLKTKLNLPKSPVSQYGQLYFYGNNAKYELFIFEGASNNINEWTVIFYRDDGIKEVVIKKDLEEVRLDSYQITEEAVYLFSRGRNENDSDFVIYKINSSNYQVDKFVIPINVFRINDVVVRFDQVFIKDDIFLLSTSDFDIKSSSKKEGVFLRYDLKTKVADTFFTDDIIQKVLPNREGYLLLCSEKNTYKTYIKYLDKELNLLKSNRINVNPEFGNIVVGARDYFFYLYNNKLYGSMRLDGKNEDYITIIDIDTSEVLYLSKIVNKNSGYVKQDVRFHLDNSGKLINLSSF